MNLIPRLKSWYNKLRIRIGDPSAFAEEVEKRLVQEDSSYTSLLSLNAHARENPDFHDAFKATLRKLLISEEILNSPRKALNLAISCLPLDDELKKSLKTNHVRRMLPKEYLALAFQNAINSQNPRFAHQITEAAFLIHDLHPFHPNAAVKKIALGAHPGEDLYIIARTDNANNPTSPYIFQKGKITGPTNSFLKQFKEQPNADKNYGTMKSIIRKFLIEQSRLLVHAKSSNNEIDNLPTEQLSPETRSPETLPSDLSALFPATRPTHEIFRHDNITQPLAHKYADARRADARNADAELRALIARLRTQKPDPAKEAEINKYLEQNRPYDFMTAVYELKSRQQQEKLLDKLSQNYIISPPYDPSDRHCPEALVLFDKKTGEIFVQQKNKETQKIRDFIGDMNNALVTTPNVAQSQNFRRVLYNARFALTHVEKDKNLGLISQTSKYPKKYLESIAKRAGLFTNVEENPQTFPEPAIG